MDRRSKGGSGPVLIGVAAVVVVIAVFFMVMAYLSERELQNPEESLDIGDPDVAAQVFVEPGDEFNVGLLGHPAHEQAAWVITRIDESVINVLSTEHVPRDTDAPNAGFLARTPEVVKQLWSNLPDPGRPPDVVEEGMGEFWYWPMSHFKFAGKDPGQSDVTLELRVDGELIHTFEFSVTVVDGDACDHYVVWEPSIKVPSRCG